MNITNLYRFLYFKLYSWQIRWFGINRDPELKSIILISLLFSLNVYSVLLTITAWTQFDAFAKFDVDKFKLAILYLVILGLNYLFLIRNQNHEKIIEKFRNENENHERVKSMIILAYLVFSVLSPFFLMWSDEPFLFFHLL